MGICAASCLYTCDCCISSCCFDGLMNGWFGKGDKVFNDPLGLVIYDKWAKQDDVYKYREEIFKEIAGATDGGRLESYDEDAVDKDLVILDFGCGTGIILIYIYILL